MKIRHPLLTKTAGLAGAFLVRGWMSSLRIRYHFLGPRIDPFQADYFDWGRNRLHDQPRPEPRKAMQDALFVAEEGNGN